MRIIAAPSRYTEAAPTAIGDVSQHVTLELFQRGDARFGPALRFERLNSLTLSILNPICALVGGPHGLLIIIDSTPEQILGLKIILG